MSTHVNQYLVFGIRLDYNEAKRLIEAVHGEQADEVQEKYDDNGYKKEIGHFEGVTLFADGMNGDYAYFGIVKDKARQDDWLDSQAIGRAKPKEVRLVQEKAKALFGPEFTASPGWHILSHWH